MNVNDDARGLVGGVSRNKAGTTDGDHMSTSQHVDQF